MIDYRNTPIFVMATNENIAKSDFKLWKYRGIKFIPLHKGCVFVSEEKFLFSQAIAKFQNLVIFDECV